MVFIETPTNPMMSITDIRGRLPISRIGSNCRVVVDNTFMSPYFQRPLELGADIVVHSTTKYLNGHSDSVGGVAVLKRKDDADRLQFIQNAAGAILSPFDSWLVLRGIKTLPRPHGSAQCERHGDCEVSGRPERQSRRFTIPDSPLIPDTNSRRSRCPDSAA